MEEIKAGAIDAELKVANSEKLTNPEKEDISALNSPSSPQIKRIKVEPDSTPFQFSPPVSIDLGFSTDVQTTPLSSSQQTPLKEELTPSHLSLTIDSQSRLSLTSSSDGTKIPEDDEFVFLFSFTSSSEHSFHPLLLPLLLLCRQKRKTGRANLLMKIWRKISSHKYAGPFRQPVAPEEAPDYDNVIKKRMDLSTVKKKLQNEVKNKMEIHFRFSHSIFFLFFFSNWENLRNIQTQMNFTETCC